MALIGEKNWILFFDEADALFERRSETSLSNDRYANQMVSYLLHRIKTCPDLVVLSMTSSAKINEAFARRFQSMVSFPKPEKAQRLRLWQQALTGNVPLNPDVDLAAIAENYELVGGDIVNVVKYAAINALRQKGEDISQADIIAGISHEFNKTPAI